MATQHAVTVLQPERQLSSTPVHSIRYLHGARALRPAIAGGHGRGIATSATSLLTSLLLTCDAMPGVMNRLRRGGWVKFWTSQIVELSGEAERTQRRLRSVLREVGVLEERRLTSGQIAMRFDFKRLLAASPKVVGAPDDDVAVEEPEPRREAVDRGPASLAAIRAYGPPELQTLSTTGTGASTRVCKAVGRPATLTNDLECSEGIDRGPDGPTTSLEVSTGNANATPVEPGPEPLSTSDRELVFHVFSAFSKHPSVARSARTNPLRTQAGQATARRVAAMIREGVPVDALASATTHHLDKQYRQTSNVVWSLSYCEPAYDRLHSDWTMRRAQQKRLRDEQANRTARDTEVRAEVVDDAVVDEVMTRYRRSRPTPASPAGDAARTDGDIRREIDALVATEGGHCDHGILSGVPIPIQAE